MEKAISLFLYLQFINEGRPPVILEDVLLSYSE